MQGREIIRQPQLESQQASNETVPKPYGQNANRLKGIAKQFELVDVPFTGHAG